MAARTSPKLVSRASKVLRRIVIYFRESRPARICVGLPGRSLLREYGGNHVATTLKS